MRQYKLICISTFYFNRVEIDAETPYTTDRMRPTANLNITMIGQGNATSVFTNYELTDQPTKQPTNQPTNQPANQPTNQPTNQTNKHPTIQPTTLLTNKLIK